MKSKLIYSIGLLVVASCVLKAQDTLNVNGGFENPDTSLGWIYQTPVGYTTYAITGIDKHSGAKSLHANVTHAANPATYWDIQIGNEDIPAPHGQFYRAAFWAKSSTKSRIHALIGDYNYTELTNTDINLTANWTKYTMVCFNAGAATIKDSLRVVIQKFTVGDYYFDDFVFIQSPIGGVQVVRTGDSVLIQTGADMAPVPPVFDNSSFTVTVNGIDDTIRTVSLKTGNKKIIVLKLVRKVLPNDTVFVSHIGGKIAYLNPTGLPDDKLIAFSDTAENFADTTTHVSIKNLLKADNPVAIYPNPVSNQIQLSSVEGVQAITITNLAGQQLISINAPKSKIIDISGLKSGYYLISIYTRVGSVQKIKIVRK